MSTTVPPVLPVSTVAIVSGADSSQSQPPIATPAFRAFLNQVSATVRNALSQRRPWSELADRATLSRPDSFSDAALRLRKNYSYFRVNYLAVVAAIVVLSLLTHPFSLLLLLSLLAAWLFLYLFRPTDQPLIVFGKTFSDKQTLLGLVGISVFVVFLTSVGSVLISAIMVGVGIVLVHGAVRVPEDLFLDEQEYSGGGNAVAASVGLFSFLNGAAANVVAATVSGPAGPRG